MVLSFCWTEERYTFMKSNALICAVLLSTLGLWRVQSAQDSHVYAIVDYMKVSKDKVNDYLEVERIWKKIHEKRLEKGLITAWYFYQVANAPADARDYQFVTVNVCSSFSSLENPFPEDVFSSVYSNEELQKYMKKTGESRDLIRSEVWHMESSAMTPPSDSEKPPYILTSYMQPVAGKEADYERMEREIFLKLHQELVNRKNMNAWVFLSRKFPGGSEVPYSYMTVNVFPSKETSEQWPDDLVTSVFPNQDLSKWGSPNDYRKIVKSDIWKPLDRVTKTPPRQTSSLRPGQGGE